MSWLYVAHHVYNDQGIEIKDLWEQKQGRGIWYKFYYLELNFKNTLRKKTHRENVTFPRAFQQEWNGKTRPILKQIEFTIVAIQSVTQLFNISMLVTDALRCITYLQ